MLLFPEIHPETRSDTSSRPILGKKSMSEQKSSFTYEWLIMGSVLFWGLNVSFSKGVLTMMSPFAFNAFRFTLSTSLMAALFFRTSLSDAKTEWTFIKANLLLLFGYGVFHHIVYQVSFVLGLRYASAGNVALILATSPLWTALSAHLFGVEKLKANEWLGLGISLAGTILVILGGQHSFSLAGDFMKGNLLALMAAMSWGVQTTLSKPMLRKISPVGLTFSTMLLSYPLHFLLVWWLDQGHLPLPTNGWAIGGVLFSGLGSIGIAYVFWNLGVKHIGAARSAAFGNLAPLISVLSSAWLLHESITWVKILGGLCIITGIVVMRLKR